MNELYAQAFDRLKNLSDNFFKSLLMQVKESDENKSLKLVEVLENNARFFKFSIGNYVFILRSELAFTINTLIIRIFEVTDKFGKKEEYEHLVGLDIRIDCEGVCEFMKTEETFPETNSFLAINKRLISYIKDREAKFIL